MEDQLIILRRYLAGCMIAILSLAIMLIGAQIKLDDYQKRYIEPFQECNTKAFFDEQTVVQRGYEWCCADIKGKVLEDGKCHFIQDKYFKLEK